MIGFFKRLVGKAEPPPVPMEGTEPWMNMTTTLVRVPPGHVLPEGETVVDGFTVRVEAGVRWHPDWSEPKITVNAFRFFSHGDCLVWAGESVLGLPVPEYVETLAPYHGQTFTTVPEDVVRLLASLKIRAPEKREPLSAFVLPEQRDRH